MILEYFGRIVNRFLTKLERGYAKIGTYDKIRELCVLRNLTIAELERRSGLRQRTIYKWNAHSPSVKLLAKVADYLGVPMERLVADKENS